MNNSVINNVSDALHHNVLRHNPAGNVEKSERIISIGAGAFIALKSLSNVFSHPWLAIAEFGIGGALLYRGITGYCAVKNKFEHSPERPDSPQAVPQSVIPTEVY